jgi:ATP-binding cassette, subfamily B, bacterial MsbA
MFSFMLKIWGLARPYRGRLYLGILTGLISGFMEPLMIATITFVYGLIFPSAASAAGTDKLSIVDHLPEFMLNWLHAAQHWLESVQSALASGVQEHQAAVIGLIALIPAVVFLRGVFSYLNIYLLQWVAIRAITDLRVRLFEHLMNLSAGFFTSANSGDLISRMTNDTNILQGIISNATAVIIKEPATLFFTFGLLMLTSPGLTLLSLVVLPLCVIPIAVFGRKVRRSAGNMQDHYSELTNVMSESFTGNRIIKAYNLEGTVTGEFRATAGKLVGHYMRIVRAMEIPGPLTEFFGAVGVALVIYYLARHSQGPAEAKKFLTLIGGLFVMYRPVKNLARLHNTVEQAKAASARVFELLATESSIAEPANPKPLKAAGADIQFDHLEFAYNEKVVLRDINLTVKAGRLVALVGFSGSGKTTLTNLLLRFYDPQKGAVRIGGTDIREFSSHELRNQIAVVTQETILFNETIRRNIELGRPGASNDDIKAAAKHAHAHEFILEKPGGYDSVIGEKGVTISGGQRQRLAIARAILRNAPILILDEATNSLDPQAERVVQAALEELMKGRTTICIAHRFSTIQKADVIVVLEQGRMVEQGTHDELHRLNGVYRKLYDLQFKTE